jgi:predicted RNA binding protein YcfA (HicA-like mRNA interferase family)
MPIFKWSFKHYVEFLEAYGFRHGHTEGSHYFYNGRILGVDRVVQAIFSHKENGCQSIKTIKMGMKHSGIPKEYYEEWEKNEVVHKEIMY